MIMLSVIILVVVLVIVLAIVLTIVVAIIVYTNYTSQSEMHQHFLFLLPNNKKISGSLIGIYSWKLLSHIVHVFI